MASRKKDRTPPAKSRAASAKGRKLAARMPFERRNYVLLLGAVGLIVAGYVLMLIDNRVSDYPTDSPLSLTVAAMMLLVGYLGVLGAILTGFRDRDGGSETAPATAPETATETVAEA